MMGVQVIVRGKVSRVVVPGPCTWSVAFTRDQLGLSVPIALLESRTLAGRRHPSVTKNVQAANKKLAALWLKLAKLSALSL